MNDPSTWTDEEWLEAMAATPLVEDQRPRAQAIAMVAAWNRARKIAQGKQFTVGMVAAPATDQLAAVEGAAAGVWMRSGAGADVVMVAVPAGAGAAVRAAIMRGLGGGT